MSFTFQNFWRIGGGGGSNLYQYYDSADNIASLANGTVNTTYCQDAFDTNGIVLGDGDAIIAWSGGTNVASATLFACLDTWDANGASICSNAAVGAAV